MAVDLGKLPPIGFNSLDVCTLLSQLQTTISELETVKANVAAQAVTCTELRSSVAMQGGLCADLSDAVSSLVAKSNEVSSKPEATVMTPVSMPVTTDASAQLTQQPVHLPRAGVSFATAAPGTARKPERQTATAAPSSARNPERQMATTTTVEPGARNSEWQAVPRKRRKDTTQPDKGRPATTKSTTRTTNKRVIIGRATDLSIKAAKRFASVFVSRLDTDVSESSLKRYLESTLKLDVTVELCRLSSSQSSFHLTCVCPEPNVFLAEDLWPDGTYVRWWRQPKPASNPNNAQVNPVSTSAVTIQPTLTVTDSTPCP